MTTAVKLQLNADRVAGDWANRAGGRATTATSAVRLDDEAQLSIILCELRGAVQTIRRGAYGPQLAVNRTSVARVDYGSPALYHGMWFVIG